ncbi:MAG: CsbD family protein [Planctomycetaceae bacterium]
MNTRDEIKNRWSEVKGRLQKQWGQLTDDDLQQFRGSTNELIGVIQRKTGATRNEIESFLSNLVSEGESMAGRVSEVAQRYAEDAGEYARQNYDRAAAATSEFSRQLSQTVRRRPGESMAIAFGIGLVAGAIFFLGRRR